jgi:glucuronate isomerase
MPFIHDDFLLQSDAARRLFHEYAAGEPILDYHNHLLPRDIAQNRRFENLSEVWLEGDHYKWRAMRASGVEERFCTGDALPRDKFLAWSATVPQTLRNPLYAWTHLELARFFGIHEPLDEHSAPAIWEAANEQLQSPELSAQNILRRFDVRALCTTDDPADSLEHHQQIAHSDLPTRVYPTFRPDKALVVHQPGVWNAWLDKLGRTCDRDIEGLDDLLGALEKRHADFHAVGGRLSDHGLTQLPSGWATEREAETIFRRARAGRAASGEEQARFSGFLMLFFGQLDAAKGWTKQLHLGALRNASSRAFGQLGPDTGFDSIGDFSQIAGLAAYFDELNSRDALPKTVVYNLNPADNYAITALCGSFQDGSIPGKMQFGSGWWFLDQKEAMEWQLNALSNNGLLSRFIGMLTDSRSFLSFPRHEYFRRVLCNLVGRDIETGELPPDFELVGAMIRGICYSNAKNFLGLEVGE